MSKIKIVGICVLLIVFCPLSVNLIKNKFTSYTGIFHPSQVGQFTDFEIYKGSRDSPQGVAHGFNPKYIFPEYGNIKNKVGKRIGERPKIKGVSFCAFWNTLAYSIYVRTCNHLRRFISPEIFQHHFAKCTENTNIESWRLPVIFGVYESGNRLIASADNFYVNYGQVRPDLRLPQNLSFIESLIGDSKSLVGGSKGAPNKKYTDSSYNQALKTENKSTKSPFGHILLGSQIIVVLLTFAAGLGRLYLTFIPADKGGIPTSDYTIW